MGLIAIKDIPKGTHLFTNSHKKYTGVSVKDLKKEKIDDEVVSIIKDFFVEEDGIFYILKNGLNDIDVSFYINHSEIPNVHYDEKTFSFIALSSIKKGEELFSDYKTFDPNWKKII